MKKYSESEKSKLLPLLQQARKVGASYRQLAVQFELGQSTVMRWLKPEAAELERDRSRRRNKENPAYHRNYHRKRYAQDRRYRLSVRLSASRKEAKQGGHLPCLTPVDDILARYQDSCAICETQVADKNMYLDHDHSTGQFRGFLCQRCNSVLGFMDDDPRRLETAADYIRKAQMVQVA